jgi:hypothetical protein
MENKHYPAGREAGGVFSKREKPPVPVGRFFDRPTGLFRKAASGLLIYHRCAV